jgi:hypothetical protein
MKTNLLLLLLFILFIIVVLIVSPLITIWAINTLFYTNIPTNLWTYLASLWLTGVVAGGAAARK